MWDIKDGQADVRYGNGCGLHFCDNTHIRFMNTTRTISVIKGSPFAHHTNMKVSRCHQTKVIERVQCFLSEASKSQELTTNYLKLLS
jgi:hypothetical protein